MAFTTRLYNHTSRRFMGQVVDINNLKVMLLDDNSSFDATDTELEDVAGADDVNEVHGNGWTEGGELLENVVVTTATTDDARLDADEVRVRATGGAIGPATACVFFDATDEDRAPLIHVDFGEELTAANGVDFLIPCNPVIRALYSPPE